MSKRSVKVKIGGKVVSVPKSVMESAQKIETPNKIGRPKGKGTRSGTLPPDPWSTTRLSPEGYKRLTIKVGKHRFYKEELSEEYVEAKMAEYRAGGVPKLITYHKSEEVTDAYSALMSHQINRPILRPVVSWPHGCVRIGWNNAVNTQARFSQFFFTGGYDPKETKRPNFNAYIEKKGRNNEQVRRQRGDGPRKDDARSGGSAGASSPDRSGKLEAGVVRQQRQRKSRSARDP